MVMKLKRLIKMTETNNEYVTRYEKLQLDRDAMRDKLKIAVEVLEFYAYESNGDDEGKIARAALASIKE